MMPFLGQQGQPGENGNPGEKVRKGDVNSKHTFSGYFSFPQMSKIRYLRSQNNNHESVELFLDGTSRSSSSSFGLFS